MQSCTGRSGVKVEVLRLRGLKKINYGAMRNPCMFTSPTRGRQLTVSVPSTHTSTPKLQSCGKRMSLPLLPEPFVSFHSFLQSSTCVVSDNSVDLYLSLLLNDQNISYSCLHVDPDALTATICKLENKAFVSSTAVKR